MVLTASRSEPYTRHRARNLVVKATDGSSFASDENGPSSSWRPPMDAVSVSPTCAVPAVVGVPVAGWFDPPATVAEFAFDSRRPVSVQTAPAALQSVVAGSDTVTSSAERGRTVIVQLWFCPRWTGPPLAPTGAHLAAAGIEIGPDTATPDWHGERLDLGYAIDVLWKPRTDSGAAGARMQA